jgi:uncharacterized protein with PQ loop repeat
MILQRIPDKYFEAMGTLIGFLASLGIATQIYAERISERTSTVSPVYVMSFLVIFMFWTIYGLRFRRPALWITNGLAVLVQALLLLVILMK